MLFDFMKNEDSRLKGYNQLYTHCVDCERTARTHPFNITTRARTAVESFLDAVLDINGVQVPTDYDQKQAVGLSTIVDKMQYCFANGYLDTSVSYDMNLVRSTGNDAVHSPLEKSVKKLLTTIEKVETDIVYSKNAVAQVSCKKRWYSRTPNHMYSVVAVDCGIKLSSIRNLNRLGCNVTVVPYNTTAEEVLSLQHDGLFIYDGPGDPNDVPSVVKLIQELQGKMPILGVELGHQLVCLANGARIVKMDCGHHGCNHPIRNVDTGRLEFAPQSHNYMLDAESVEGTTLRITHVNVLDGTPEACESTVYPTLSAQFDLSGDHPLYEKFLKLMEEGKRNA